MAVAVPGDPVSNREVVGRFAREGRRGARTDAELDELAQLMGEELGVRSRYWAHVPGEPFAADRETSVDLQTRALEAALDEAGVSASELGAILCATSTPARCTGANGPVVATRVGARCAALDIRMGCTGGIYALAQACLMAAQSGQPIAVCAADTFSLLVPPSSALAALALGDAGCAAVVCPTDGTNDHGEGLLAAVFASDGSLADLAGSHSPFPPTHDAIDAGAYTMREGSAALGQKAVPLYQAAVRDVLSTAGVELAAVDLFAPHQTSRGSLQALVVALEIAPEKTANITDRYANCGAGSALAALDALRRTNQTAKKLALLAAVGGGVSWGALLLRL
jgi:3-oxoacyl-[acyl-carrier-protein] synthase-3